MTTYKRYGIYYAPPRGSALASFGASWLGWDAEGGAETAHPASHVDVSTITATPRKYGFHGTLKPPFRMTEGMTLPELTGAVERIASKVAPFEMCLRLARLGRFCALVPEGDATALAALAASCVQDLDRFRAPPDEAELARRRKAGLTPAQEAMLLRWGYPYVLGEFRFHLTLTGPLDALDPEPMAELERLTAPLLDEPVAVPDVCLFGEGTDGRFRIVSRHSLTG